MLDGALAERARVAVGELAEAIAAADVPPHDAGAAALWWAYAGDRYGSAAKREAAVDYLCEVIDEVDGIALHGGVVGLAWALAHVADDSAEELLAQFDELVVAQIDSIREFDLIGGLAGHALYFLERPDGELHGVALRRIVSRLDELRDGPLWRDREGRIDLGLAHGAPGVVAALARIAARMKPIRPEKRLETELLAEVGVHIRRHALPDGEMPSFAGGTRARTAWCYGDPGLSVAFAGALPDVGRAYAMRAANREPEDTGVKDAAFCHGAFGLAHVLQRWWHATGDAAFAGAARRWIERGLAMPRPTGTTLLEGAPGAALALVAALGGDEPGWGRMLACDL